MTTNTKRNDELIRYVMTIKEDIAGIKQHLKSINGSMQDFNNFKDGCGPRRKPIYDRLEGCERRIKMNSTNISWLNRGMGAVGGAVIVALAFIAVNKLFGGI